MQTSKYLIPSNRDREWGLTVNTVGYEEILPGTPIPLAAMPKATTSTPRKAGGWTNTNWYI